MSIEALRAAWRDPEAAARAHRGAGGRVVAFLCDNVPTELISAAGAFPLRVHGRPNRLSGARTRLVDTLYPPDVTQRPDFVGSMLDALLDGRYDIADAVIVPHNRNAVQAIHRELADARAEYGVAVPTTWYLDKAWSPFEEARAYNRQALIDLRARLESMAGAAIDDASLEQAVNDAERARDGLAAIAGVRNANVLCGSIALEMMGAYWSLPASAYARLAVAAVDEIPRVPRQRLRVYLGGSPVDHPAFYAQVEKLGGNIVAEDHCWGERAADARLSDAMAPFDALAERFHATPACSIRFPLAATIAANRDRALRSQVDAAIFRVEARDAVQAWETPEQVSAFEAAGIPTLHLRMQPYGDESAADECIAAFFSGLAR
ncbi:MAG: hypothetical protein B7Y45_01025 [Sphingomonas sp. 28-66-16]|nr:MAG: hypothetical protein B7Y45_01025 [Sphingomonas sp. 28-66-16]